MTLRISKPAHQTAIFPQKHRIEYFCSSSSSARASFLSTASCLSFSNAGCELGFYRISSGWRPLARLKRTFSKSWSIIRSFVVHFSSRSCNSLYPQRLDGIDREELYHILMLQVWRQLVLHFIRTTFKIALYPDTICVSYDKLASTDMSFNLMSRHVKSISKSPVCWPAAALMTVAARKKWDTVQKLEFFPCDQVKFCSLGQCSFPNLPPY